MDRVLGFTALVAVIDVVLLTAIATFVGVPLQHGGRAAGWPRSHSCRRQLIAGCLKPLGFGGVIFDVALRLVGQHGPIAETVRALP